MLGTCYGQCTGNELRLGADVPGLWLGLLPEAGKRTVQEMSRGLTPLLNILAATGRNAETVMQEVGQMRAGWLACDYRAWLKAYNPDFKRTKLSTGMVALFPDAHPRR